MNYYYKGKETPIYSYKIKLKRNIIVFFFHKIIIFYYLVEKELSYLVTVFSLSNLQEKNIVYAFHLIRRNIILVKLK